ncbi:DUF4238 domain-containing protein [Pedobacter jejuensis]|uniref:DUF4238 domain-containing protein n=1 Tax=Pedobacter jejuensis TaxID=1268550 RepID=A0A3N0BVF6_9SPHI|nr:DUF4238 domain-containing protein [Pedobacter jejuensis]RNL53353.1 DUF4238 domain-containing protein [Pedobacter jejuensis]
MTQPLAEYERLQEKLRKASEGIYNSKLSSEDYSVEKAIQQSSTKHHYLPQYFIDGFLATDGLLSIYDKQRDTIKRERKGSGGVFFEPNRNSTDFGFDKPISLFEEAYGTIDNLLPAAIRLLRAESVTISNEIFIELMANIDIFIIDLFWRNINTDRLFDQVYENGKMTVTVSGSKVLSNEETDSVKQIPGFKQLARLQIFKTAMQEALSQDPNRITNGNLISFPLDQICIGDMPFLFPFPAKTHTALIQLPVIVPISKSKIYLRNVERTKPYDFTDTCMFNALIIEQSSKFICSSNPTILQAAIDYHRFAKENDSFQYYRDSLFHDTTPTPN